MKEKVKQTMGELRKSVRAAGVGLSTLAASFFMSAPAYMDRQAAQAAPTVKEAV